MREELEIVEEQIKILYYLETSQTYAKGLLERGLSS